MPSGIPDLDIYIPDHRGTGRSARLSCAIQERFDSWDSAFISDREWADCIEALENEWGYYLEGFTTTAAAHDLGNLIEQMSPEDGGGRPFVYGVSYGTYWAHRYLQLYPNQPAGVILDSICPPETCVMNEYDHRFNQTAELFFGETCAANDTCRQKLGEDPWAMVADVFQKMEEGACPQIFDLNIDRENLRKTFGALFKDWALRVYVPAVVYRIDRCSEADVAALMIFAERMGLLEQFVFMDAGLDSAILGNHVLFSELWDGNQSQGEIEGDGQRCICLGGCCP